MDLVFWTQLAVEEADFDSRLPLLVARLAQNMATWQEGRLPSHDSASTTHSDVIDWFHEVERTPVEVSGKSEHRVRMNLWKHGDR